MHFAGVDIGSTMTKVVILNEKVVASSVIGPTGAEHRRLANRVMQQALSQACLSPDAISYVVATGYGRINVPFADKQVTEISCHARGIAELFPTAKTVIDIGGQDSKGIKITDGKVSKFVMNDKCAAGTGRFLEAIADALGLKLDEIGEISLRSRNPVKISNTCTVFAEQEITTRLAEGATIEDVLAGVHQAMASRVVAMASRLGIEKDVVVTGGGAQNAGLVKALEDCLGFKALVPPEPLLTGALGAALLAREYAAREAAGAEGRARRLAEATFFNDKQ